VDERLPDGGRQVNHEEVGLMLALSKACRAVPRAHIDQRNGRARAAGWRSGAAGLPVSRDQMRST
jgi:hypothetical protein